MEIYREQLLDHYKNPRHYGLVEKPTHQSFEENISCGDEISLSLVVEDGTVVKVGFEGQACVIAKASASLLSEKILGMVVEEVKRLSKEDVLGLLGIEPTPSRLKCALLPLEALRSSLHS